MSKLITVAALVVLSAGAAAAQESQPPTRESRNRAGAGREGQAAAALRPEQGSDRLNRAEDIIRNGLTWHPFFENAYGRRLHARRRLHETRACTTLDVRGSITPTGYKRFESEFIAPQLFGRRGTLLAVGGWREATQVGFYGFGMTSKKDERADYSFQQPYLNATLTVFPAKNPFLLRGAAEVTQWKQNPGKGGEEPSVETIYTPQTLPGLATAPVYLHTQGAMARLANRARLHAARRALHRHAARLHRHRRGARVQAGRLRGHPAHPHPPRSVGQSRSAAASRPPSTRAISRFRSSCCHRLAVAPALRGFSLLALPRLQQPAAASGVAGHGEPILRHRFLLRHR